MTALPRRLRTGGPWLRGIETHPTETRPMMIGPSRLFSILCGSPTGLRRALACNTRNGRAGPHFAIVPHPPDDRSCRRFLSPRDIPSAAGRGEGAGRMGPLTSSRGSPLQVQADRRAAFRIASSSPAPTTVRDSISPGPGRSENRSEWPRIVSCRTARVMSLGTLVDAAAHAFVAPRSRGRRPNTQISPRSPARRGRTRTLKRHGSLSIPRSAASLPLLHACSSTGARCQRRL